MTMDDSRSSSTARRFIPSTPPAGSPNTRKSAPPWGNKRRNSREVERKRFALEAQRLILQWAENGAIPSERVTEALAVTGVTPTTQDWKRFLDRLLLWAGTTFLAAGLIFSHRIGHHRPGSRQSVDLGKRATAHERKGCLFATRSRRSAFTHAGGLHGAPVQYRHTP